jgi:hypothetical protein
MAAKHLKCQVKLVNIIFFKFKFKWQFFNSL